jgi:Creatinase/Prolidase N-terminal domain
MRRGLMQRNPQELPLAALDARIARLRADMKSAGLDAVIIYTNLVRPSAVTWLTGFTPYWSEGLLLVPMTGRLAFATALSNRVADWIRSTNPVSDVVSTPRPGVLLGERLAKDDSVKRAGVLELDALPSELADDLSAAAPAVGWIDATAQFARVRRDIDAAEQQLLARSDAIAVAALDQTDTTCDAGTLAGLIEKHARLAGAEEIHVAVAPDLAADRRLRRISTPVPLADRFAVRASVAYKGAWLRRTRTFAGDRAVARADAWFDGVIRGIDAGKPIAGQLAAYAAALGDAALERWMVESCVGSYPLSVIASSRLPGRDAPIAAGFAVLTIELLLHGGHWIGTAPLIAKDRAS